MGQSLVIHQTISYRIHNEEFSIDYRGPEWNDFAEAEQILKRYYAEKYGRTHAQPVVFRIETHNTVSEMEQYLKEHFD